MSALTDLLQRIDRRLLLAGVAGLLLLLNLGHYATQALHGWQERIDQQELLLAKYRKASGGIDNLKRGVALLEQHQQQLQASLFSASSEEEVASSMQILLQELVVKAGLEPEFLQPVKGGSSPDKDQPFADITVKLRLSGSLNNFVAFIQHLYGTQRLITVESFSLKPFRGSELKIFLEVKGYYSLRDNAHKQE